MVAAGVVETRIVVVVVVVVIKGASMYTVLQSVADVSLVAVHLVLLVGCQFWLR